MRIYNFRFQNKAFELKIEPINFSNLSLLVGISGVGKTMILQALLELKRIIKGRALNGIEWEILFSTNGNNNSTYRWNGSFELIEKTGAFDIGVLEEEDDDDNDEIVVSRPKLEHEELYLNDKLIATRKENEITFLENKLTLKLSSYKSLLNLLAEEEIIRPASESFNKIIRSEESDPKGFFIMDNFEKILQKYTTIESIRNAHMPINIKLALIYKNQPTIFTTIKEHFIDVFPQIEDVKLELLKDVPFFMKNVFQLQIKEKEVAKWIAQDSISSGMFKTLMQISEIYLCAEGTVILIDEFENSLGINCIDTLIENLLYDDRHLQFIVTSHHPYIINAIGMEHWKIVSRHGGTITTKDAKDFKIGNSRHEAFKQLIQLADYREGIKV